MRRLAVMLAGAAAMAVGSTVALGCDRPGGSGRAPETAGTAGTAVADAGRRLTRDQVIAALAP